MSWQLVQEVSILRAWSLFTLRTGSDVWWPASHRQPPFARRETSVAWYQGALPLLQAFETSLSLGTSFVRYSGRDTQEGQMKRRPAGLTTG